MEAFRASGSAEGVQGPASTEAASAGSSAGCSASDWGSLPLDLVSVVLGHLNPTHQAPLLGLKQAAQALACASPNRHWRAAALQQLCFAVRLESAEEVWGLAGTAIPCHRLELPSPLPPIGFDDPSPTVEEVAAVARELERAAEGLLGSPAFQRGSTGRLRVLLNCPAEAVQLGLLAPFAALSQLSVNRERLNLIMLHEMDLSRCPVSARQLEVVVMLGAGKIGQEWRYPSNLDSCRFTTTGHERRGSLLVVPCACDACVAGFWGTLRRLHLSGSDLMFTLDSPTALRSCSEVRLSGASVHIKLPPLIALACALSRLAGTPAEQCAWEALATSFFDVLPTLRLLQVEAGRMSLTRSLRGEAVLTLEAGQVQAARVSGARGRGDKAWGLTLELTGPKEEAEEGDERFTLRMSRHAA